MSTPQRNGRGSEYETYIRSEAWQQQRRGALERAHHRCQVCNTPNRLDVHHRTYERFTHERPEDLTVLCRSCHDLFHGAKKTHGSKKNQPSANPEWLTVECPTCDAPAGVRCSSLGSGRPKPAHQARRTLLKLRRVKYIKPLRAEVTKPRPQAKAA